jgi:hypothetical protein
LRLICMTIGIISVSIFFQDCFKGDTIVNPGTHDTVYVFNKDTIYHRDTVLSKDTVYIKTAGFWSDTLSLNMFTFKYQYFFQDTSLSISFTAAGNALVSNISLLISKSDTVAKITTTKGWYLRYKKPVKFFHAVLETDSDPFSSPSDTSKALAILRYSTGDSFYLSAKKNSVLRTEIISDIKFIDGYGFSLGEAFPTSSGLTGKLTIYIEN